jgi:anthranilate/para-aminobenzoate synthase component I
MSIFENAWFGYIGYEMLHQTETLKRQPKRYITLPDLYFTRFGLILEFDHQKKTVVCHRESHISKPQIHETRSSDSIAVISSLSSTLSKKQYLDIVSQTREAINRGDFYQANITRKFTGSFASKPDDFSIFKRLCNHSPAAYSAFIRINDISILSSSPERFIKINARGDMTSSPIKGTAPRFNNAEQDALARTQLESSPKDRAENLMIVDLMRNDLSRSAEPGSIKVERLFEVSSYATLHHMASTITGQKRANVSALEAVEKCFPPGSMTGAPKVRAMDWCLTQEGICRGVYSGALGWFGGDGSCDLSVVIRTLIVENQRFEFQVGGGIVADSEPEKEWEETMVKAQAIANALGIDINELKKI